MPYSNYGWLYCGIVVYHVSAVVLPARWGLGVAGRKNRAELWYYHLPQPPSFINITRIYHHVQSALSVLNISYFAL